MNVRYVLLIVSIASETGIQNFRPNTLHPSSRWLTFQKIYLLLWSVLVLNWVLFDRLNTLVLLFLHYTYRTRKFACSFRGLLVECVNYLNDIVWKNLVLFDSVALACNCYLCFCKVVCLLSYMSLMSLFLICWRYVQTQCFAYLAGMIYCHYALHITVWPNW